MNEISDITTPVPFKVIEPRRGWLSMNWRELWHYRELLFFLTWRDVTVRYKQTVLGFLWAFIQPFMNLVVFSAIFGGLAKMDSEGYPYPIFLYSAMLPWQFFSGALSRSSLSIVGNARLITKVYFPRLIVPISSVGACLADFLISFSILFGLMMYYHITPGPIFLLIFALIPLTIITSLGIGIFISGFNATYRDFQYLVPFALQIWMFATPMVYPLSKIPEKWRWLIILNPMTGLVEAYRSAILNKPVLWDHLAISVAITMLLFIFGLYVFRRLESRFADIV